MDSTNKILLAIENSLLRQSSGINDVGPDLRSILEIKLKYNTVPTPSWQHMKFKTFDMEKVIAEVRSELKPAAVSEPLSTTTVPSKPQTQAKTKIEIDQSPANDSETPLSEDLIAPVTPEEYANIPDYMRRYIVLADLNKMITGLIDAVAKRNKLFQAKFSQLSKLQKDEVIRMRDERVALKLAPDAIFVSDMDWKNSLDPRLKAKVNWGSQHLRSVKRIKEARLKGKIFYIIL